ncbi:hypothetical protein [Bradyrhizobium ottawaense]|uniref:hypothetical protein n=1 Tax=Bradyrhizobium ottawaense TaxID=931866 RepID=UPI003390F686
MSGACCRGSLQFLFLPVNTVHHIVVFLCRQPSIALKTHAKIHRLRPFGGILLVSGEQTIAAIFRHSEQGN